MYRLIVTTASIGLISGYAIGPAYAARGSVDPSPVKHASTSNNGNGDHNRSAIGIKSPTSNRGYQHTNNGNAGGLNNTLNTLCRHATHCKMIQNLIIINVERRAPRRDPADGPKFPAPAPPFLYLASPDGVVFMG